MLTGGLTFTFGSSFGQYRHLRRRVANSSTTQKSSFGCCDHRHLGFIRRGQGQYRSSREVLKPKENLGVLVDGHHRRTDRRGFYVRNCSYGWIPPTDQASKSDYRLSIYFTSPLVLGDASSDAGTPPDGIGLCVHCRPDCDSSVPASEVPTPYDFPSKTKECPVRTHKTS